MPTQRFDGATLEDAVAAARVRLGTGAKIVGASRVRRGGVGGFFAHEHVEVEVDVPGPAPEAANGASPNSGTDRMAAPGAGGAGVADATGRSSPAGGGRGAAGGAAHQPAATAAATKGRSSPVAGGRPGAGASGTAAQHATGGAGAQQAAGGIGGEPAAEGAPRARGGRNGRLWRRGATAGTGAGHVATGAPRRHGGQEGAGGDLVDGRPGGDPAAAGDPMSELIQEMAREAPSSVLDLAEQVNAEQSRFTLGGEPSRFTLGGEPSRFQGRPAAAATRRTANSSTQGFAAVLARIARQEGLVAPEHADDILPEPEQAPVAPAQHTRAILAELAATEPASPTDGAAGAGPSLSSAHAAGPPAEASLAKSASPSADERLPVASPGTGPRPAPAHLPVPRPAQPAEPARHASAVEIALRDLGLPAAACAAVAETASALSLESELRRVLEAVLPELPPMPRSPTSVVAVVGPKGQVMDTARALAVELGAPANEVALATQRNVWRHQERVMLSPEVAAEERRSWRWRDHPSVVAVETPVRPHGDPWARAMLRALEPTICWGVTEAHRKPEDVSDWSESLGGFDVLALVDLASTSSPAAALSASVPVGRLDGVPASPGTWAQLLCSRLMVE